MLDETQVRPPRVAYSRPVRWGLWLVVGMLVVFSGDLAQACPNCKETLAEGGAGAMNLVRGYFWSILFMMSMPFLILGTLVSYFYYEVCKARARQEAGDDAQLPPLTSRPPRWASQQGELPV
jgi:uncharacterized membrane protein